MQFAKKYTVLDNACFKEADGKTIDVDGLTKFMKTHPRHLRVWREPNQRKDENKRAWEFAKQH